MKNIKGVVTALIIIIFAAILNIGLLLFFDFSLLEEAGFVQSGMLAGPKIIGITSAISGIFWLLFLGNYWGFLTGALPTEKKLIYRKGIGSFIIFLGAAICTLILIKWASLNNFKMDETFGTFSLCTNAFGILWVLLVKASGVGWPRAELKKESKISLRIILLFISLAAAFALELGFIYAGRGTLFDPLPAVGKTILAPNLDYSLWAIFWIILAGVLIEKIPYSAKLKAFTLALWLAIIAYLLFWVLKFYFALEPGPISAVFSGWAIFGVLFTINARAHLKD